MRRTACISFVLLCGIASAWPLPVFAQTPAFVAPPRTIADITAILDQQKPDPAALAKMRADAAAQPPSTTDRTELAQFHYTRCTARTTIGDYRNALADCEKAVQYGQSLHMRDLGRYMQSVALLYQSSGDPKKALGAWQRMADRIIAANQGKGFLFNVYRNMQDRYLQLGDFAQAEAMLRKNQALMQEAKGWDSYGGFRRATWEADLETSKGRLFEARGQFREAEASYFRGNNFRRDALRQITNYGDGTPPPPGQMEQGIDFWDSAVGRMKARQGRIAEGEAAVRKSLLSRLKATSKYNLQTTNYIGQLSMLLVEQGRFSEAEQLTRSRIDVLKTLGVPEDAQNRADGLNQLASILNLQGRWDDAAKVYAELEAATKNWDPARRQNMQLSAAQIATLYNTNNLAAGVAAAERLFANQKTRFGEGHLETALTRGLLAIGYARSQRDADALREFKLAVPVLMTRSRETDTDDPTSSAAREQRAQIVIEAYIGLLARMGTASGADAAAESFRLADAVRSQSVQRALASSSARTVAKNPALADLVRKSQDLEKQVGAQLGALNNALALPPEERDDKAVKTLQGDIDKLRGARDGAKKELAAKFKDYASLVDPAPPTAEDIRAVMRADEAFLSFYFGRDASFVWAVPKSGPVTFVQIPITAGEIDTRVKELREALEPNVASVGEIPPFDLKRAHELYAALLGAVEPVWKSANSLIVSTNGALGLLPLGVLPTAPAELKSGDESFASYRDVPWLARSNAVTLVPSAAALRTLRQLPVGSAKREQMIGFGDPIFSPKQIGGEMLLASATATRGLPLIRRAAPQTKGVDSAQLALLPRLPDTADELKSVALALQSDPTKALNLGKAANEETVKSADLSKYRIIVFATHGLVPGELDGLHQPALALSAPEVAGVSGDGLLTMEEILALKLDADWVVLSACNTGAGAGAGAEAASGLGRAFFYAGTRAILVTNWSVHSASARELVTDVFARQTADPKLTRGEALRQASMALLDGQGFTDEAGKTLFTYGHPLFWAPYTIIGDGG